MSKQSPQDNPQTKQGGRKKKVETIEEPSEEMKNMKRQKRLEKNREAAQQFRQRQREYITDLEGRVSVLNVTNSEYKIKLESLDAENKILKDQLSYLRSFIGQAVSVAYPADSKINNDKGT
eukprot:TRINITY_DN4232_c0_g1_i1.p1 TRINITY_DN4232_c0_g1~~TRINITY_DN4232_c0_g1_i1.p1  ORF type:complete len:136 (+),score=32.09 TRINITY_DN4232_c0_g1_i1:46-408(+)